ncbi:DUF2127 domain-containing protein [Candidatus Nephthysia bennettiae]|uniref:DUF2127 domain-containing protein n=1 Tax=Candidatus Nephthysia bennettiae TaxID=3127016 RepID=A0A934KCE4_9BACT|nr:DUF2127 domain-containing protein [Candidatus Dormibacteraeota bacterium]
MATERSGRQPGSWLGWEFGRRIEVTPVIRLITLERFLKATVLVAGSAALLFLDRHSGAHQVILNIQSEYNLDAGRGLWHRLVGSVIDRAAGVPNGHLLALAVAGLLYGGLEALEGVGLLLRRRWAEYLVLVATVAFIPVEVRELATRPSVFKVVALLTNLLIVAYLIWRKRLFLERPSEMRSVQGTDTA